MSGAEERTADWPTEFEPPHTEKKTSAKTKRGQIVMNEEKTQGFKRMRTKRSEQKIKQM